MSTTSPAPTPVPTGDCFELLSPDQLLDAMSREARALLLYLETRAVDHGGIVDTARMNADDMRIAKDWAARGFLSFSRMLSRFLKDTPRPTVRRDSHVVELSGLAWECAGLERRRRAKRSVHKSVRPSLQHHAKLAKEGT